ncbi:protein arginine N-methyltransferase 1-like [Penaeus chinensis]|uniref:protein arginine N-methyltransferase 1-like n=1 Tax=Penaeus chinensis TaxID=139456 RepID=UPI001FB80AE6|nr:protein arginine N-methyltransferase 1-like [Penaeus chinensis]XP_047483688.1 protein arginine N-methyltransferase 1-like [Penaeus chinensis]
MEAYDDMPPLEDDDVEVVTSPESSETMDSVQNASDAIPNRRDPVASCEDDDNDDDDDGNEEDWEEMEENTEEKIQCLFCKDEVLSINKSLSHIKEKHDFDLASFICKFNLDQIAFIKLINYIRKENPAPKQLIQEKPEKWECDSYMKPVDANDSWLMFDVEELTSQEEQSISKTADPTTLQARCDEFQEIIEKQRETMTRMLQAAHANSTIDNEKSMRTVGDIRPEEDEGYFNSYAHFDIHHEMLSDRVRTESYRDAILKNAALFKGKRVLDLGCGTSILSMFSAKAGANVTGVDMSDVIYKAMDIVKENNLEDVIKLHKGKLEDLEFEHKFDYIVSEWMGYFLLFEGMLDSVLYARDKHLAEGGLLLPNRCTMHLVGMEDEEAFHKYVSFWDDVYGFKMTCMKGDVVKEANTDIIKEEKIITSSDTILDLDLMTITPNDTEFTSEFSLTVQRDGLLTGFVGYFDTYFEMPTPVFFSTGPHATPTHWKQTVFYLPEPHNVKKDEVIKGVISVRRKRREIRSLDVGISFNNKKFKYLVE